MLKDIGYDRTITLEVFTNSDDAKSSATQEYVVSLDVKSNSLAG
jgi:hypothetical protein